MRGQLPGSLRRLVTLLALAAVLLAMLTPAAPAVAVQDVADMGVVTDGTVEAIDEGNGRIYLGGSFNWIGPRTGSGVVLNDGGTAGLNPYDNIAGVAPVVSGGSIYAVEPDGGGGYFIGGDFRSVNDGGGVPRPRIGFAHILSSGALDVAAWNFEVNDGGRINALLVDGSDVIVGGSFIEINALSAVNIARLSSTTKLWGGSTQVSTGAVNALLKQPSGTGLIVGGAFNDGLMLFPDAASSVTSVGTVTVPAGGVVHALAPAQQAGKIIVGGNFGPLLPGPVTGTENLAAVDDTLGTVLTSWRPAPNGPVYALETNSATAPTELWVGGSFNQLTNYGGIPQARTNLAQVTPDVVLISPATNWIPSMTLSIGEEVRALQYDPFNGQIIAGGTFRSQLPTGATSDYLTSLTPAVPAAFHATTCSGRTTPSLHCHSTRLCSATCSWVARSHRSGASDGRTWLPSAPARPIPSTRGIRARRAPSMPCA